MPRIATQALVFLLLAVSSRGASYDDDVASLVGPDAKSRKKAIEHLSKGGQFAIAAVVNRFSGTNGENKLILLDALRIVKSSTKGLKATGTDTKELARIAREEKDRSLRYRIIDAVSDVGDDSAVAELVRFASEDPEERIRAEATRFVGSRTRKDIAFFKKQSKDPSPIVRLFAGFELARIGDKSARDFANQILKDSKDNDERSMAISILGEIGVAADGALLRQISESPKDIRSTRIRATKAAMTIDLLQLPERERLSFLMKSLDSTDALVRDWAYSRLWNLPDPATASVIKKYLAEPGHRGYSEAMDALSQR